MKHRATGYRNKMGLYWEEKGISQSHMNSPKYLIVNLGCLVLKISPVPGAESVLVFISRSTSPPFLIIDSSLLLFLFLRLPYRSFSEGKIVSSFHVKQFTHNDLLPSYFPIGSHFLPLEIHQGVFPNKNTMLPESVLSVSWYSNSLFSFYTQWVNIKTE